MGRVNYGLFMGEKKVQLLHLRFLQFMRVIKYKGWLYA